MTETSSPNVPAQAAPTPAWVGQGTAVEQSRAVAQVQAALWSAKTDPRSLSKARTDMGETCAMPFLAERAFYSFPRSGQEVTGLSIILARELARCWRNVDYGLVEMRRDDHGGLSEMMAFAWDLEANTRVSSTFIVPHKRDKRGGPESLVDMRDIYENNTNQGSRRVREAIFAVLSPAFVQEAKERCLATLEAGDGKSLDQRRETAVKVFGQLGVPQGRLEQKLGRPVDRWTVYDVVQLRIAHRSIERGEVLVDDEFPPVRVTTAEIQQQATRSSEGGETPEGSPSAAGATAGSTPATAAPPPDAVPETEYADDDPERPFA